MRAASDTVFVDRRLLVAIAALGLAALATIVALSITRTERRPAPLVGLTQRIITPVGLTVDVPPERTIEPYRGLGTWVDGFDFAPAYSATGVPPLVPAELHQMAEAGVRTVYLQSGRLDERSPDLLEDRWILTEFLMRARLEGMAVVAWYLPKWDDDSTDLDHLIAAAEFEVLGHRFDSVAVDIEWNQDGLEPDERSRRFVALSRDLRAALPDEPIGAIVLPPVQTEVVNPSFWPEFPWAEIADLYDVWMPMSYWSFRADPWSDAYAYNRESTERLRANIGDPDALVHGIGGIGAQLDAGTSGGEPIAGVDQLEPFARSLVDTNSIGGSIYDWMTIDTAGRDEMTRLFIEGVAADLGG